MESNSEKNNDHPDGLHEIEVVTIPTLSPLSNDSCRKRYRNPKKKKESLSDDRNSQSCISILQNKVNSLQVENEVLISDKAILEIDLLETQQETFGNMKQLRNELFALKEEKAKDEIDLLNIIISLERKLKQEQARFIELFEKKDEEISKLQKRMKTRRSSRTRRNKAKDFSSSNASFSSKQTSLEPSVASSTVVDAFEKKSFSESTLPNVFTTSAQEKNKLDTKRHNEGEVKVAPTDKKVKSKKEKTETSSMESTKESNADEVELLLKEREQNQDLIQKMKKKIELLCEALETKSQ